jgi:enoyl-CoA hydratase/carnithine racemase
VAKVVSPATKQLSTLSQPKPAVAVAPFLTQTGPHPGVVLLTMNRPQARNALSMGMLEALTAAIASLSTDPSVRAVVLAAEGPGFCAGHDLKELTSHRGDPDGGRAFFEATMSACARMMQAIVTSPKPFIAAVEGMATAAGCQLVASCDLAVASPAARFATPGVNIGLFCSTPMVALSRNVAPKHAMEMLLLGDPVDTDAALRFGLINRVVPIAGARKAATDLAVQIASKSSAAIATGKRAFYQQREMTLAAAYDHASRVMVENLLAADSAEGICAFIEKRPAVWAG